MLNLFGKNWWFFLLRGIAAVLFGLTALFVPKLTLLTLVIVFGVYVLIDGMISLAASFRERNQHSRWWVVLLEGVVGVAAGGLILAWPEITALALLYLAAGWALLTGVLELIAAFALRKVLEREWLLVLSGLASVAIAAILFLQPEAGFLATSWMIGIYAVLFGLLMILLSLRLRSWYQESHQEKMQA